MDRIDTLHLVRCNVGEPAEAIPGVGYRLAAEADWLVEGPAAEVAAVRAALPKGVSESWGSTLRLCFRGTLVGRISAGALGDLHVHSGKWTEADYDAMLEEIARRAQALPFDPGAPSALPYSRDPSLLAADVSYHAFVWLRHALVDQPKPPLLGALQSILANPHRRLVREEREVPVELASAISARTLDDVVAGRWPFQKAPEGRGLGPHGYLPLRVSDSRSRETVDTPENRFVKAFLDACDRLLTHVEARIVGASPTLGDRVRADLRRLHAVLTPLRRAALFRDVGRLTQMPVASTVLQRQAAYREVLRSHVLLRAASRALPISAAEIVQMLEVKNIAKLYELWCGFHLLTMISEHLGAPIEVTPTVSDAFGTKVRHGLLARWSGGVELAFNPSYKLTSGWHGLSRSVDLRPDFAVYMREGPAPGLHFFDAKFRRHLDAEGSREARVEDLHKMHAYRDAIPKARSAWVLFPGDEHEHFLDHPDTAVPLGVGAFPALPGKPNDALKKHLQALLGPGPAAPHASAPVAALSVLLA